MSNNFQWVNVQLHEFAGGNGYYWTRTPLPAQYLSSIIVRCRYLFRSWSQGKNNGFKRFLGLKK